MDGCPLCGSPMQERETSKKVVFLVCSQYPTCQMSATPVVVNALVELKDDNQRLLERLDECRGNVVRMMNLYADARGDNPIDVRGRPCHISEAIDELATVYEQRWKGISK